MVIWLVLAQVVVTFAILLPILWAWHKWENRRDYRRWLRVR